MNIIDATAVFAHRVAVAVKGVADGDIWPPECQVDAVTDDGHNLKIGVIWGTDSDGVIWHEPDLGANGSWMWCLVGNEQDRLLSEFESVDGVMTIMVHSILIPRYREMFEKVAAAVDAAEEKS